MCRSKSFLDPYREKGPPGGGNFGGTASISLGFVQRIFGAIDTSYYSSRQVVLSHVVLTIQCCVLRIGVRTIKVFCKVSLCIYKKFFFKKTLLKYS